MLKIKNVMIVGLSWLTGFRLSFNSQNKSDTVSSLPAAEQLITVQRGVVSE